MVELFFYMKKAILLLQNGEIFAGQSFGFIGQSIGEVCFNTSMTGYQEVLTDPSYQGQMVWCLTPILQEF